jgi:hypothetical protein
MIGLIHDFFSYFYKAEHTIEPEQQQADEAQSALEDSLQQSLEEPVAKKPRAPRKPRARPPKRTKEDEDVLKQLVAKLDALIEMIEGEHKKN